MMVRYTSCVIDITEPTPFFFIAVFKLLMVCQASFIPDWTGTAALSFLLFQ